MAYPTVAPPNFTTVECHKQVRSWRLLRSIVALLIQACTCTLVEKQHYDDDDDEKYPIRPYRHPKSSSLVFPTATAATITGTIFGSRTGKVNFCIQANPKSQTPILLLELTISTTFLAREMKSGNLRIALECSNSPLGDHKSILSMPLWTMYCNGRKVGFAFKRRPSSNDIKVLKHMENVHEGAGTVKGNEVEREEDIMYLRGFFNRVTGKSMARSETFHLIDPDGNIGQELSIFFLRPQ